MEVEAPGTALLSISRFGPILRECSGDARLVSRNDAIRHVGARRAERISPARREPGRISHGHAVQRRKASRIAGPIAPRIGPPHAVRHRQRKQPLCLGRRAAGNDRQADHGRGHRRPPPGEDGRAGAKRRRPSKRRHDDDRSLAGHATDGPGLLRAGCASANRGPSERHSGLHAAGDDLFAAGRRAISPLARCVSAAARCAKNRAAGRAAACGRPAGRDRHERRKPRHRFQVCRRHADVGRPGRRGRASRTSSCRSPTPARPFRSRSIRAT